MGKSGLCFSVEKLKTLSLNRIGHDQINRLHEMYEEFGLSETWRQLSDQFSFVFMGAVICP